MAAITICSDFGAQKNKVKKNPVFLRCFAPLQYHINFFLVFPNQESQCFPFNNIPLRLKSSYDLWFSSFSYTSYCDSNNTCLFIFFLRIQLADLITWTTALSNSMKLSHAVWGHPRRTGHGGEVWQNVVHWRREWQTTSVFLPWEPHKQYEKAKW